ncbi:dihydrodipicolinate synthetase [Abortiporus biennis]|nr:dihydrodipicolinate synthetase [Abortiporus biennis]
MGTNGLNGLRPPSKNTNKDVQDKVDTAAANGVSTSRVLKPGIFAPIPTFFLDGSEDLDLKSFATHVVRVAKAGVGPLIAGSMGEAIHLTHSERTTLIQTARHALDDAGLTDVPLIVGTGTGSTRETIQLCKEAAEAGADFAIVITSGYFAGALANNRKALKAFFVEVAAKSPIPIIIYNYPGASGGIDLDSDLITELAEECPNTAGVKLTCGNVGKLTRICATVSDPGFTSLHPRKNANAPFLVLGGFIDFLVPSTYANAHGAITGLANVAPHTIAKLFELSENTLQDGSLLPEAQRLQGIVARADYTIAKASIAGTKSLLQKLYGYGGNPRKPLPPFEPEAFKALWNHPHTQELVKVEKELSGKLKA